MNIGDIVVKKSYDAEIYFKVSEVIDSDLFAITGINYRLKLYSRENELERVRLNQIKEFKKIFLEDINKKIDDILEKRKNSELKEYKSSRPGKVLHVDADKEYLEMCKKYYEILDVPVIGKNVAEKVQSEVIKDILKETMPDILVITGHDSLNDKSDKENLGSYRCSAYFIDAVKEARWFNPSKDSLVIIAGACQSYFEALVDAGANIASSPKRILIHALDPVFAAEKVAYTPMDKILSTDEILENTFTGEGGIGAYQTRGTLRLGTHV